MTPTQIAQQRLANQHLADPALDGPAQAVRWLGAVQSQDYAGAKWALGQRLPGSTDAAIEQAMTEGAIVRTHVLRPTWHFVAAADIRWMLKLSAPRVHAANGTQYRQLGLDRAVFRRSHAAIEKALRDGQQLTRAELAAVLARARIATDPPLRVIALMMAAELDGVICSGARRGKQFTYALLEERVPPAPAVARDEALCELCIRYFTSRGPATLHDFAWWSGLTLADAKRGVEMAGPALAHADIGGRAHWFAAAMRAVKRRRALAHLLPNFDEYFIGFADRSAIQQALRGVAVPEGTFFGHVVTVGGQLVGAWKRLAAARAAGVALDLVVPLSEAQRTAVQAAARRYARFLELPLMEDAS
jgi:hypothetical protein